MILARQQVCEAAPFFLDTPLLAAELQKLSGWRTPEVAGELASLPIILSVDNTEPCQISLMAPPNNWQGVEG